MDNEYRVDIKVRNNLILEKIERLGYKSLFSFCKNIGISYATVTDLCNMKLSIYNSKGQIRSVIIKLCKILNCNYEEIFTSSQAEACLKTNKTTLKVKEAEMIFLVNQNSQKISFEEEQDNDELKKQIERILQFLRPREREILKMRFGINETEKSYNEIGKILNLTGTRISQIERKAIRKIKSDNKTKALLDFF